MSIAPENHILNPPARLYIAFLSLDYITVHELNAQINLILLGLFVEDGQNLGTDIAKSEFLFIEGELLTNLVFARMNCQRSITLLEMVRHGVQLPEGKKIRQQIQEKITALVDDA